MPAILETQVTHENHQLLNWHSPRINLSTYLNSKTPRALLRIQTQAKDAFLHTDQAFNSEYLLPDIPVRVTMCIQYLTFCTPCNTNFISQFGLCQQTDCAMLAQQQINRIDICPNHKLRLTPSYSNPDVDQVTEELWALNMSDQATSKPQSIESKTKVKPAVKHTHKRSPAIWIRPFPTEAKQEYGSGETSEETSATSDQRSSESTRSRSSTASTSENATVDTFLGPKLDSKVKESLSKDHGYPRYGCLSIWDHRATQLAFESVTQGKQLSETKNQVARLQSDNDELIENNESLEFKITALERRITALSKKVLILEHERSDKKAAINAACETKIFHLENMVTLLNEALAKQEDTTRQNALKHGLEKSFMQDHIHKMQVGMHRMQRR